ncbi:hypothetical protein LCGC14_1280570 [marine sediment metagenome]|uniref:Uncharacterized protein n=1 Tax=marine sediment metagenome TaxID=412755 RepID=A0A0F9LGL0_9ZZZZ
MSFPEGFLFEGEEWDNDDEWEDEDDEDGWDFFGEDD